MAFRSNFKDHARLMFDLLTIALQTDTTRISTFMLAREGSNRSYREIGVPEGHHGLSHHRNDPALMDKVAAINRHHMDQFAYFLTKLKKTQEGEGRCSITPWSSMAAASATATHNHDDLPVLLAGGSKAFKTGRHVRSTKDEKEETKRNKSKVIQLVIWKNIRFIDIQIKGKRDHD